MCWYVVCVFRSYAIDLRAMMMRHVVACYYFGSLVLADSRRHAETGRRVLVVVVAVVVR